MFFFRHDLSSLKVLGSVGEPINPEAWLWYYKVIGQEKCSIADTFWQTETGGHVITPLPGCTPMKPGSAVSRRIPYFEEYEFSSIHIIFVCNNSGYVFLFCSLSCIIFLNFIDLSFLWS